MKYAGFDISSTLNLYICLCNLNVSYINLFGNIIILLNSRISTLLGDSMY